MKRYIIIQIIIILSVQALFGQTTHQIAADGMTYNPESITIQQGDFIQFTVGSSHPTIEVSMETWESNGTTPIENGFDAPTGTETIEFIEAGTFYYVCKNHISSGMKGKIIVEGTTDTLIPNYPGDDEISVYPNPVNEFANLDFVLRKNEMVNISLYNLLGSKVKVFHNKLFSSGKYNLPLNFSELPSGIYYLNVETKNEVKSIKIVK
jgi:plastocyanin